MGLGDLLDALRERSQNQKTAMQAKWEKQAQRAQAKQPPPLTETQALWQRFAAEQAAARTQQPALCRTATEETAPEKTAQPTAAAAPAAARPVASTGFYTVTWKVRLTTLGQLPLPAWLESS